MTGVLLVPVRGAPLLWPHWLHRRGHPPRPVAPFQIIITPRKK